MENQQKVDKILYEQLEQLRKLSESESTKNEPELIVKISLAMSTLTKAIFRQY